jgi:hypothetical protein
MQQKREVVDTAAEKALNNTVKAAKVEHEHSWSGVHQFPDAFFNHHGRHCLNCGVRQGYGKRFGSNKHPGFSSVGLCTGTVP